MNLKSYKASELLNIANKVNEEFQLKLNNAVTFFNSVSSERGVIQLDKDTTNYYWSLKPNKRTKFSEELIRLLNETNKKTDNYNFVTKSSELLINFYYENYNMFASEEDTEFGKTYIRILHACAEKASEGDYEFDIDIYFVSEETLEKLIKRLKDIQYVVEVKNNQDRNVTLNIKLDIEQNDIKSEEV